MTDSGYSYLYRGPGPDTGPHDDYPAYWQQPPPGTPRQAPPEAGPQGDYPPFWQQRPPTTQALPPQAQPPRETPRQALPPQPPPGPRKSRAALAGVLVFVVTFALCGGIALASRSSGNQHPAAGKPPATGAGAGSSPAAATSAPSPVATAAPTVNCYGTPMPADECAGAQATTWAAFIAAYPAGYSAASAAAYCSQSHPAGQPWFEGCVWDLRQDSATHAAAAPPQPASGPTTAAPPAPAPAQSAAAASCTKTAEGNCIKKGQFCSDADHNQNGTDAEGETLTCEQAGSRWYWES